MLFLPLAVVFSASAQAPLSVEWKAGRLTVTAESVPLVQILEEIARQTGVEVQGHEQLREPVSVRFSLLPLREGLQRLLAHVNNYVLLEEGPPQGDAQPALVLVFPEWSIPRSQAVPLAVQIEEEAVEETEPAARDDDGISRRLAR